jgi:ATP-dependent exoDNAse (exonuclease V) beta subunit
MGIAFDRRQLEAVQVESNAVVRAGAGSGKTAVLSERFLWLLQARKARIEEILALTFTQKAAAEMYERIYTRLREEPGTEEHLRRFDQAQISTLDSFCSQIARDAADRFGLPPVLRYDEEAVARLAEELALDFLLEQAREPPLAELLRRYDFNTLRRDLFVSLAVDQFHLAGHEGLPATAERQLSACLRALEERWAEAQSPIVELMALEPRTPTIAANQEALRALARLPELARMESFAEAGALLGACVLKKPGGKAAGDVALMKELVDRIRAALAELGLIASTLAQRETLRGLFALLERFRLRFLARKRALGLVTFRDVAEMAVEALLRNRSLRRHYQRRFRYILIDEFQDNNRLQKDLLYLLAEREESGGDTVPGEEALQPDKLFFVGDEKQSIYRFRGADVSVFASLHAGLERSGGRSLVLDRNYRSLPGLIRFFNRLFAQVLAGASRDFEARFQEMYPPDPLPEPAAALPAACLPAEVHLLVSQGGTPGAETTEPDQGDALSREEAEALAVARWIRSTVDSGRLAVLDDGSLRPAEFRDIAVLLRSTGNQIHVERMLRQLDIPYSTPNVRSLFLEAPAGDLYVALRLALYPEDRAAYAGFLRSPFVNLSDDTLLRLLLRRAEEPFAGIDDPSIPEPDRLKLSQGMEVYRFVREHADRLSPSELLHRLWYEHGYRFFILREPSLHNYLEFYDYLMALAERSERQGDALAGFLELLRENLGQYRRLVELEVPVRPSPGVQLLTIHKAKGLQFPIVILADMGNRGRAGGGGRPYYLSEVFGVTLNLGQGNYFSLQGERETEAKELAEARRLLYVAATRARCHLVLAGTLKRAGGRAEQAHLPMVLSGLGLSPETVFQQTIEPIEGCLLRVEPIPETTRQEVERLRSPARRPAPDLARLSAFYTGEPHRRPARRREYTVSELCALLEPEPGEGRLVSQPALAVDALLADYELENRFGSLVHDLLARWIADPEGPCPAVDWRRPGIAPEHREACLVAAASLARRFLDSPLGRQARSDPGRQTELPFLYRWQTEAGPLYMSGQMDLVFTAEGRTWLLDYKTDRSYREGQYDLQLAFYALACAELVEQPVMPLLFLLRSGREVEPSRRFTAEELLARLPR